MSIAQTIQRLMSRGGLSRPTLSPNLLINPMFEHMQTRTTPGEITLPTEFQNTFRYAPGWYDFGGINAGNIGSPSDDKDGAIPGGLFQSAVRVQQITGELKGLCQKIPRGAVLNGRRIRVTGKYRIRTGGNPDNLTGISLWLKSDKETVARTVGSWGAAEWTSSGNIEPSRPRYNYLVLGTLEAGHIIRMTSDSVTQYNVGEELLNRAFDWWGYGTGDVETQSGPVISGTDSYIAFGGPSIAPGVWDRTAARVWYLDKQFDDNPATGTKEIYTETQNTDNAVFSFETYVDLPSVVPGAGTLWEDNDVWLCAFPVSPASTGSMLGSADIEIQHLSIELVLDSDDPDDQLLGSALTKSQQLPIGMGHGGFSGRDLLQYPIFAPYIYKLNTVPTAGDVSTIGHDDWQKSDNPSIYLYHTVFETTYPDGQRVFCPQSFQLPPGSSVMQATYDTFSMSGTDSLDGELIQELVQDATGLGERRLIVAAWPVTAVDGQQVANVHRNKIGAYWGDRGDEPDFEGTVMAAGNLILRLQIDVDNVGGGFGVEGGYLIAAVDPRWGYAQWGRGG